MTRTAVDNTIARLKAWVRENENGPGWGELIDDLEDLRQHDEVQAAELVAAEDRFRRRDARVAELTVESSRLEAEIERLRERITGLERMLRSIRDTTETWL